MEPQNVKKEAADQRAKISPETTGTVDPPNAGPKKPDTLKFILNTLVFLAALAASFGGYYLLSFPVGKIISPPDGSRASREIAIEGYTKNIPPEQSYIWITIDVKDLGQCWPKQQIHQPNQAFKTKIHETGPNKNIVVSLYAVDQNYDTKILKWLEEESRSNNAAGLSLLPGHYKLDSITLTFHEI
ncbi:MAG: hypothetical protein ABIK98_07965 [Pseudomonadota bacterium]